MVLGILLGHEAATGAPIIEVTPTTLDVPALTLGDQFVTGIKITNLGDALLTVTAITHPPEVELSQAPPFYLAPDSSLKLPLTVNAIDTLNERRELQVESDDPAQATVIVTWQNRVRAIQVETLALATGSPFPLGEPVVVESVPLEGINVERMTLYYRSSRTKRFEPIDMTRNVRAFIGIIPGEFVLEGTLDFYVRAENGAFATEDPAEGERRPYSLDIGSPHEFGFDPVVSSSGFTWSVGENVDFILELARGTVFDNGKLWYRRGGETEFQSIDILEMSFTGIAASIPGSFVGPTGVQYWAEINTLTSRLTDPRENPDQRPIELRVSMENLVEPNTRLAERYRLFSVPCELPPSTGLGAILSDQTEFGAYDPMRWRAFRYLPELGINLELPAAQGSEFDLVPGRAYWLISRAAHRVDTAPVPGLSTRLSEPWPMVVAPGWNAIGNPFNFSVPWSSVQKPPEVGDPVAFDSERNQYAEEAANTLEPFEGYFVENTSDRPETVYVFPTAERTQPAPRTATGDRIEWRLEARSESGRDVVHVGVANGAVEERDAGDAGKPPEPPEARVRMAIANRDWRSAPGLYRRDLRPPAEGHSWDLEVTSATPGEPIEVVVMPREGVPPSLELRLLDREQGSRVELARAPDGTYRHSLLSLGPNRPYRWTLLAGTPEYVRRGVQGVPTPERVMLDPVAPNPAHGALRLRFGIPHPTPVRLEVFDVTGQRITTLLDGTQLPEGYHAIVWRGTRPDGSQVPSGVYFCRLAADRVTRVVRAVFVP